jgi:predicted O-linked N-acetylglucosamine transferase (SPINDLY family)
MKNSGNKSNKSRSKKSIMKALSSKKSQNEPGSQEDIILATLFNQNQFANVEVLARSLTSRFPLYGYGWKLLGASLHQLKRLEDALFASQRAAELLPDDLEVRFNLSLNLYEQGRFVEAETSLRRILELEPNYARAYNSLGTLFLVQQRLTEAEACFVRGLAISPNFAWAHSGLGCISLKRSSLLEAEACFRKALEINPDLALVHSNLLFCLSHNEKIDAMALFAEHCRFGERFEAPLRAFRPQHSNSREPERRLQVGFVSADFWDHAVATFIEPVLDYLAGYSQLVLHAYYNNNIEDDVTGRLRGYFKHWHPIVGLSDDALAEKIRSDGIDILIDLSGHSGENRLPTFARKPAPVQVSWIGYPGTTGLSAMDYYLADRFFLPHGQFDDQFTEKIVRLPASAPFKPVMNAPSVNALPALTNGYVTFGSFNGQRKISQLVIALWSQLLRALPDSRMVLGGMSEEGEYNTLIDWFETEGISRERLSFHKRCVMTDYLALHQQVDICLDTYPYNGGTTTFHALWMGVPTLTLAGNWVAGRSGACILGHVDLAVFVAQDATDFVMRGLAWADNLSSLASVRTHLRERFQHSAVGKPAIIAAGLERALRIMWQRWCLDLPAESFEVSVQILDETMQDTD